MFGFVKRYFHRKKRKKELVEKKSLIDEAIKAQFDKLQKEDAEWYLSMEMKSFTEKDLPTSPNALEDLIRSSVRRVDTLNSNISIMKESLENSSDLTKGHITSHESGMTSTSRGGFRSTDDMRLPAGSPKFIGETTPWVKDSIKIIEDLDKLDQ